MSKSTVRAKGRSTSKERASAQSSPKASNHRVTKSKAPRAPAPASTIARDGDADRELLAMIEEARALNEREDKALQEEEAIAGRMILPEYPASAVGAPPHIFYKGPSDGRHTGEDLKELRLGLRRAQMYARRAAEIIEAVERYEAGAERVRQESGYRAAEAKCAALRDERFALWQRIMDTPAKTTRGTLAKLAFAGLFICHEKLEEDAPFAENIALSAAIDAQRAAKESVQ